MNGKKANIKPIFKKGDKKQALNYRPISLTSVVMTLSEKIIRDKLVAFLEANKLITENQHALVFRNNRSCLTSLLDFFNLEINAWVTPMSPRKNKVNIFCNSLSSFPVAFSIMNFLL